MDSSTIQYTLQQLGVHDVENKLSNLSDGATALLSSNQGSRIAVIRRGINYDALVVGTDTDCPVPALRAVLETAVLPLSDDYAAHVGVAVPERDAVRRRIREASVALDVIAKGRLFSVALPDIPLHKEIKILVEKGATCVDDLPDGFVDTLPVLNQLQANVVSWSKEIDRVIQISQNGPGALLSIEEETVFWSSLDAALAAAQKNLSTKVVKLSLEILARKRRATGFLIDATNSLDTARRKAAGVLTLIQGLPIVAIRTAEDLPSLKNAVVKLLDHVAAKLRISSFSVERVLSLVDSMGTEVCRSIGRIMTTQVGILTLPFTDFISIFESCCDLFEAWSQGFDHCRKVAREAARKRGETMPARSKSPLSKLYKHLSNVYEVRSDHQAIREVLLQLSTIDSAATRRIELLDSTYVTLVNNNSALNHFELSANEENVWLTNCSKYKKQMRRIEEKIAGDYITIVKHETDLQYLAQSLRPFESVLEKQFMAQATADSIPSILALGSQSLKSIRNREQLLLKQEHVNSSNQLPYVGVFLSESRLLRNRLNALLHNMEQVCGKTHVEATPDLRDFVSELEELRQRLDPHSRFSSWVTSIDLNCHKRPLLSISFGNQNKKEVGLTIGPDEAMFFKVIRLSKEINELHQHLSKSVLDFSRASKSVFPVYSGLKEAIDVFTEINNSLSEMDLTMERRVFPFVSEVMQKVQTLIEDGFRKQWNDDVVMLKSFVEDLRQSTMELYYMFQLINQSDKTMSAAVERISKLYPKFTEGNVSSETKKTLDETFQKFVLERTTLSHYFSEQLINKYFQGHWDGKIKQLLWLLTERLTKEWIYSSEGPCINNLRIELDITQTAARQPTISCYPKFSELEVRLYNNLIESYKTLVDACASCFEWMIDDDTQCAFLPERILAKFLSEFQSDDTDTVGLSPFQFIDQTMNSVVQAINDWNEHLGLINFTVSLAKENENSGAERIEILDAILKKHEAICSLIERDQRSSGGHNSNTKVRIDSANLGKRLLSITSDVLEKLSVSYAEQAADESQQLYNTISGLNESLQKISGNDGMELLALVQSMEEDALPRSKRLLSELSDLEKVLDRIADGPFENCIPRAIDIDTWILSETIIAHFSTVETLHQQKTIAIKANEESFRERYTKMREEYQQKVASLFTDFQSIRDDTKQYESFIEMELLLQDLEHQLQLLDVEGTELSKMGRALKVNSVPETNGPKEILTELEKVRRGLEQLTKVEGKLKEFSSTTFRELNMINMRDELNKLMEETERISVNTGARKEAIELKELISSYAKGTSLLKRLRSITISPPRQRDLLQKLFPDGNQSGSIFDVTLSMFWKTDLPSHEAYLKIVLENAAGEASICDFLSAIDRTWLGRKVSFYVFDGTPLIQNIPSLIDELEEHLHGLETMKGSPYAPLFESERSSWENRLANLREDLTLLTDVQSRWAHLKSLFGGRDGSSMSGLRTDLQKEFLLFSSVHVRFSSLLNQIEGSPGILESFDGPLGLAEMNEEMQGIVRGLSSFLEKQRAQFPRFFFLSDNDLLHVLSVSSDQISDIIPYIHKMFPGIVSLQVEKDVTQIQITGILSKEGEEISFTKPVVIASHGRVVHWLRQVQDGIEHSQKIILSEAMKKIEELYSKQCDGFSADFITAYASISSQMLLLAMRLRFTSTVEEVLKSAVTYKINLQILIADVELILSQVIEWRHAASNSLRIHLLRDQLIKELVRQQELLNLLVQDEDHASRQAFWNQELRFYKESQESQDTAFEVRICCGEGSFLYGWEYLGIGETLVNTSLTSRCFLILCEALRRGYGGSPFGPAGTGKTETVKALGRILGRFVAVFNCDESFDSVSVGRILAGACRIGCWVCFDEFNRLSSSSLSSTSGHLATLQTAIRKKEKQVSNFYGGDISITIENGVGIFVTMNPTYSGRRELPANLKSLFRPCSMAKPDTLAITKVLLRSNGFLFAPVLAKKLVALFHSLQITLSKQSHYDFGLRALKSTVTACGKILMDRVEARNGESQEQEEEEIVLIQGMGVILKPKLHHEDIETYNHAVHTVLDRTIASISLLPKDLEESIDQVIQEKLIADSKYFREKISQLYSLLRYQSGVILVGDNSTGKSTTCNVLFEAMKRLTVRAEEKEDRDVSHIKRISVTRIDPKLLSARELYGHLDPLTREWSDGLFTKVLRSLAEEKLVSSGFALNWIVFDGDIDPDWVESLNSVLDDNKILTLPNGEQVPLLNHTRILFETDSLTNANPSTISRCGMICFGQGALDEPNLKNSLRRVFNKYETDDLYEPLLDKFSEASFSVLKDGIATMKSVMSVPFSSKMDSFITLCRVYSDRLKRQENPNGESGKASTSHSKDKKILSINDVARILMVSAVKTFGAGLNKVGQRDFSRKLFSKLKNCDEIQTAFSGIIVPVSFAEVELTPEGEFKEYAELIPNSYNEESQPRSVDADIVIPTPSTVRLERFLTDLLHLKAKSFKKTRPVVLCGPPGCGKSMILMTSLRNIPNVAVATLSFSSETSPSDILVALKCQTIISKRSNGSFVLHPKVPGYRVVLFCDELNLQTPDKYGTQSSICFLRSLAEYNGYWDGNTKHWVSLEDVQVVAACNPPEDAGRHDISSRFLRHCTVIYVEQPDEDDLKIIYEVFVKALLKPFGQEMLSKSGNLTNAMVEFFSRNKERFSPISTGPLRPHYVYSPRELSRWVRGMKRILISGSEDSTLTQNAVVAENCASYDWEKIVSVFCYEARRLFRDRLLTSAERQFTEQVLFEVVRKFLQPECNVIQESLYTSWLQRVVEDGNSESNFEIVRSPQRFRDLIYQKLRVFAEEEGLGGSWMSGSGAASLDDATAMIDQFAVTDDVLTHLTRIERILSQPLGHAVLVGAPGTGKKTLARFAAWMLSIEVHQVHSHSAYTEEDFANDLRKILRRTGVNRYPAMMIFDESNVMDSSFLEMMNSVLACGEVPGLFSGDELSRLLEDLKNVESQSVLSSGGDQALYAEFVNRVRRNLHVVFTMSSHQHTMNEKKQGYQHRSRPEDISARSPALYNRCTVDWIGDWNRETLEAVADLKIEASKGQEKDQLIRCAVEMHEVVKQQFNVIHFFVDITPRHYLEFIEQLNRIALEKGKEIEAGVDRHKEGLQRLKNAGVALDSLKDALGKKSEKLQLKERNANQMLGKMMEEQRLAEKSKVEAEQLACAAAEASAAVREREEQVAAQIAEVQPKIEAARAAVGSIRKEYLEELRAMPNPPSGVKIALEGVLMVLDGNTGRAENHVTWSNIRARMRGSDFISNVVNFEAQSLPKGLRTRIEKRILRNPDFDVPRISYASRAAGPLAEWTLAVLDYITVKEGTEPLQFEVEDLQEEQKELIERQESALAEVNSFNARINECRMEYARLVSEAERVRQDIQESQTNLRRSEEMLDSLADEWDRWICDLNKYNAAAVTVWGNAILGAAFIAYLGVLDHIRREKIVSLWKDIMRREGVAFDDDIQICNFLTTAKERGLWATRGLSNDSTSVENYAILKRSARYPMIVDPSRNSNKMLQDVLVGDFDSTSQNNEGDSPNLRITESSFTATGKRSYMRALESGMRFGTSLHITDADKFDRAVAPLLGQEISYGDTAKYVESLRSSQSRKEGESVRVSRENVCQRMIRLGDRDVALSPRFRLYLSTADISAVASSAITRTNVVSFEMSPAALGAKCISDSINILAPHIEEKRRLNLTTKVQFEEKKHQLEEKVLTAVNDVQDLGAELLNGPLLETLTRLKKEVKEIETRQREEENASNEMKIIEGKFSCLGNLAIDIFGVLQSLQQLNPIYIFKSSFFLRVFGRAITACKSPSESIDENLLSQCQRGLLVYSYRQVVTNLFPIDRLSFAASLALISHDVAARTAPQNDESGSIVIIQEILRKAITKSNRADPHTTEMMDSETLELLPLSLREKARPEILNSRTANRFTKTESWFRVLCAFFFDRCRISDAIDDLACTLPGQGKLVHGENTRPEEALKAVIHQFANTKKSKDGQGHRQFSPILLCARGENSNPTSFVVEFAGDLNVAVISIAMGASVADNVITDSINTASKKSLSGMPVIVLLKNMHLASKSAITVFHSEISRKKGKLDCLVIVAAEVSKSFTAADLLGAAPFFRVFAFESPPTFRANLALATKRLSVFSSNTRNVQNSPTNVIETFQVLLAWLHASLLERAYHSPLGFSKPYEFSEGDLSAAWDAFSRSFHPDRDHKYCLMVMMNLLSSTVYGCRVELENDQEIIAALIKLLLNQDEKEQANNDVVTINNRSGKDAVSVPSSLQERMEFISSLPVGARPEWSYLPTSANRRREAREGLMNLEKVLVLCRSKFQSNGREDDTSTNKSAESKDNFDYLIRRGLNLPDVSSDFSTDFFNNIHSASIQNFLKTESTILSDCIEQIKTDLEALVSERKSGTKEPLNIVLLRKELEEICTSESRQIPSCWKGMCEYLREVESVGGLFDNLKNSVEAIKSLQKTNRNVMIPYILRPTALFEALKYEAASKYKVSPHTLTAYLCGQEHDDQNGTCLSRVWASGAKWNQVRKVFVLTCDDTGFQESLRLIWRKEEQLEGKIRTTHLNVPLYTRGSRRELVFHVRIPVSSETSAQEWRLNGTYFAV